MSEVSDRLKRQYQEIADAIEMDGIGYAVLYGGHVQPNTDDEELNNAINMAISGLSKIDDIISPYRE